MSEVILFPHQVGAVVRAKELLKKRGVFSDRSETGCGKTPVILRAAKDLELPFAVICPKTLISHWRRWCALMEIKPIVILNWEACKLGKCKRLFDPKGMDRKWLAEWPGTKALIIFDEAHRAKTKTSQNSQMVRSARAEGHWLALLSATLIQSPLDLLGLAYPLNLIGNQRFAPSYAKKYGVGIHPHFGGYHDFSIQAQRLELNVELDKVGLRIRKSEICPTMCIHRVDLVDSEKVAAVKGIYEDLEREIAALQAKGADAIQMVTKRLHARQAVELAKVPVFVEETLRHLEEGARVALFLCFQASVDASVKLLVKELSQPVPVITGKTGLAERDTAIQSFNFGDSSVLVCNIAAGGEGISLHDQDGRFPRVGLLSIPESSTHLIQALGRNDRVGAKSVGLNRILFCAGTMEEKVYENLSEKIRNIDQINDADLGILSETMKK